MIGTSPDAEFYRLSWYRVDDESGGRVPLYSASKGFYQPNALDFGHRITVEGRTTLAPGVVSSANFGPVLCEERTLKDIAAMADRCRRGEACGFEQWRVANSEDSECRILVSLKDNPQPRGDDAGASSDPVVLQVCASSSSSSSSDDVEELFQYDRGSDNAILKVVLDAQDPRQFILSKSVGSVVKRSESLGMSAPTPEDRDVFLLVLEELFGKSATDLVLTSSMDGVARTGTLTWHDACMQAYESSLSPKAAPVEGEGGLDPKDDIIKGLRAEIDMLKSDRSREANRKVMIETGKQLARVQELSKDVERLVTKDVESQRRISELFSQTQGLQAKIARLEQEKTSADQVAFQLRSSLKLSETESSDLRETLLRTEEELATRTLALEGYENSCFQLRTDLKNEEDLRIARDARVKDLEEAVAVLQGQLKMTKAKSDTLAKEVGSLLHFAGVQDLNEVKSIVTEKEKLKGLLASRQAEKQDLVQENLQLRQIEKQHEQSKSSSVAKPSPNPKQIGKAIVNTFSRRSSVGETDKASAAATQAHQLRQLANSLLESVNEKEELLKEQRFANKVLADKLADLERQAVRWRR